jgi:xylulokinase
MKDLLLGIDVGTYSSKATLTDLAGAVLRCEVAPHEVSIPRPGHVEQDADTVWWADVCRLCQALFAAAGRADETAAARHLVWR